MTPNEQLDKWVAGNSVHNSEKFLDVVNDAGEVVGKRKLEGGECCPDFSCCQPDLKWDEPTRRAFAAAHTTGDRKTVDRMLMMALGALVSKNGADQKVHVVDPDQHEQQRVN